MTQTRLYKTKEAKKEFDSILDQAQRFDNEELFSKLNSIKKDEESYKIALEAIEKSEIFNKHSAEQIKKPKNRILERLDYLKLPKNRTLKDNKTYLKKSSQVLNVLNKTLEMMQLGLEDEQTNYDVLVHVRDAFDDTTNLLGFKKTIRGYSSSDLEDPLLIYNPIDESMKLTFGFFDEPNEIVSFDYDGALSTMKYIFTDKNAFSQKYLEQKINKPKYVDELVDLVTKKEQLEENSPFFKQYFLDSVPKIIKDFVIYDNLIRKKD